MLLEIYLLGQFKLKAAGQPVELPSRPAQSLLAYLVLNAGATLRREKLASLMWSEANETNARSYLRQALWRIRKSLDYGPIHWEDFLQINEISVTFDRQSEYWLDVEQFVRSPEGRPLEDVIEDMRLYRGELLPGFYDGWVGLERDRLQTAYFQRMNYMLDQLIQARRWNDVLNWSEQWILHGFSPEPAYRALMKAYAGLGNPGMVSATYQRCVEALDRDLEVEPSPETKRLYEQLQRGEPSHYQKPALKVPDHSDRLPFLLDQFEPRSTEKPLVVAREREMERLNGYLNLAVGGQGRVVFVTGEAGSGKTTLVNEFTRRARNTFPELIVASGNCNANTGIGDPYLPFREALGLLSGDVVARWSAGAITKDYARFLWNLIPVTARALMESGPDLIDTFISGSELLERAAASTTGEADWLIRLERFVQDNKINQVNRAHHQNDLFIQYSKVLQVLSRNAPMILVVDDLQWADPGSIGLLFHLGRHLAGRQFLIVGAYRPEEVAFGRGGERHSLESVVNELQREYGDIEINVDRTDCQGFVDVILDSEPNVLGRSFREMLCQLTHGHPLFTIELLRGMQERGDLVQDENGRWVEAQELDWETLPARVEAVIAERVGRLDPSVQTTLRIASVEGEVFTAEVVARVQALQESEILSCLSNELDRNHRLVRAQSIQRSGGQLLSSYRFRHILVQKYLYNSLDDVERVHLHEKVGETLEELFKNPPGTATLAPQLARHFQEAKLNEKAILYMQQAGERALQVSAYQEAISHLEQGLALLKTLPAPERYAQQELSLQLAISMAWYRDFEPMEMEPFLVRALELCQQVGSPTQYCQTLAGLSVLHYVRGDYLVANELALRTVHHGQEADDRLLIALGHWCLGITNFAMGNFQEARKSLEYIADLYNSSQHHRVFVFLRGVDAGLSSLAYLACCLWCLGYPEQAQQRSLEALELAHEINHSFTLADVLLYGGCVFNKFRRDPQALKENAEELIHLGYENSFPAWLTSGKISMGEALIMQEHFQEGLGLLQEGVQAYLYFNVRCYISGAFHSVALAYANMGDNEQGLAALNEAFELMERTSERCLEAEGHRIHATLQRLQGDDEAAEVSLEKALEVARRQHAIWWELQAAIDLARLWQEQGRRDDARQILEDIYSRFSEGLDMPELRRVRALYEMI